MFSYAVLGPLHYLTEISWLHKNGYFTKRRTDYLILIGLAGLLLMLAVCTSAVFKGREPLVTSTPLRAALQTWGTALIFAAFASALVLNLVREAPQRTFALLMILVVAVFIRSTQSAILIFSVFMPTLIHVFVFTGAFLLYGALKGRSVSGILSFAMFLIIPLLLYLSKDFGIGNPFDDRAPLSYDIFSALNIATIKLFHLGDTESRQQVYYSGYGLLIMRFIAYAYTYHYLNWFSKMSIIKWHRVPKLRLAIVLVLWAVSIGLYAYDYKIGTMALFFLSFTHVFLEFPLNHLTFIGIGNEVRLLLKNGFLDSARMSEEVAATVTER